MCHLLDRSMWKLIQFHEKLAKSQVIDVAGDTHCGNCGNLLSPFFGKNFEEATQIQKKKNTKNVDLTKYFYFENFPRYVSQYSVEIYVAILLPL